MALSPVLSRGQGPWLGERDKAFAPRRCPPGPSRPQHPALRRGRRGWSFDSPVTHTPLGHTSTQSCPGQAPQSKDASTRPQVPRTQQKGLSHLTPRNGLRAGAGSRPRTCCKLLASPVGRAGWGAARERARGRHVGWPAVAPRVFEGGGSVGQDAPSGPLPVPHLGVCTVPTSVVSGGRGVGGHCSVQAAPVPCPSCSVAASLKDAPRGHGALRPLPPATRSPPLTPEPSMAPADHRMGGDLPGELWSLT